MGKGRQRPQRRGRRHQQDEEEEGEDSIPSSAFDPNDYAALSLADEDEEEENPNDHLHLDGTSKFHLYQLSVQVRPGLPCSHILSLCGGNS